jgi:hypothetical protein
MAINVNMFKCHVRKERHLMDRESACCGFNHQIPGGQPQVMDGSPIVLCVFPSFGGVGMEVNQGAKDLAKTASHCFANAKY